MMRNCKFCNAQSTFICRTCHEIICELHIHDHIAELSDITNHQIGYIKTASLSDDQKCYLTNELKERLRYIGKLRLTLRVIASKLIEYTQRKFSESLQNLNKISKKYKNLLQNNEIFENDFDLLGSLMSTKLKQIPKEKQMNIEEAYRYFDYDFYFQEEKNEMIAERKQKMQWRRFLQTHNDAIMCVVCMSDKDTIITGGDDKVIKFWSLACGGVKRVMEGHENSLCSLALDRNDIELVSGSVDATVRIWNLSTFTQTAVLKKHESSVLCVAISPNNKWIASGSIDQSVCIWRRSSRTLEFRITGHSGWVAGLALSNKLLVAGSTNENIAIWNFRICKRLLNIPDKCVNSIALSSDNTIIASGSGENTVRIWDLANQLQKAEFNHEESVHSVTFTNNDKFVVSGSKDKIVCIWDIASKTKLASFDEHSGAIMCIAQFSCIHVASVSKDSTIIIWDVISKKMVRRLECAAFIEECCIFYDNNRFLLYISDKLVHLWDFELNYLKHYFEGHNDKVRCIALSSDSTFFVSGSKDGTAILWNLKSMTKELLPLEFEASVRCIAITLNNLFVICGSADRSIRIWSLFEQTQKIILNAHRDSITCIAATGNSQVIASSSKDKNINIWSLHSGDKIATLSGHRERIWRLAITNDDHYIFSGSDDESTVKVWDIEEKALVSSFQELEDAKGWLEKYPGMIRLMKKFIN